MGRTEKPGLNVLGFVWFTIKVSPPDISICVCLGGCHYGFSNVESVVQGQSKQVTFLSKVFEVTVGAYSTVDAPLCVVRCNGGIGSHVWYATVDSLLSLNMLRDVMLLRCM